MNANGNVPVAGPSGSAGDWNSIAMVANQLSMTPLEFIQEYPEVAQVIKFSTASGNSGWEDIDPEKPADLRRIIGIYERVLQPFEEAIANHWIENEAKIWDAVIALQLLKKYCERKGFNLRLEGRARA